jgi:hypothetical protein
VQWFLAPNNAPVGSPVLSSIGRTFRYHLGTAFFGSAIIATVQFFRLMVQAYLYGVSRGNESNSLVIAAKALANCCLKCLERFLDFVNKNAYIQTAIEGTNFCSSAYNGFTLLLRNALRLAAIAGISTVFLAIGKVFVAALTGFISALIIMGGDIQNITSAPVFSVTVIVLIAFAVASAFMDSWVRAPPLRGATPPAIRPVCPPPLPSRFMGVVQTRGGRCRKCAPRQPG